MLIDYYQILGVAPNATLETIKSAYRAKALESHPDRHPEDRARWHPIMVSLNEAYDILSDPEKRRRYDEARIDQSNRTAQESAAGDSAQAKQRAGVYPQQYGEFESWLDRFISRDFTRAEYEKFGMIPLVFNSFSGALFLIVGAIVGGLLGAALFPADSNDSEHGRMFLLSIIGGGAVGLFFHKAIADSVRQSGQSAAGTAGAAPNPTAYQTTARTPTASAQEPSKTVQIRCISCRRWLKVAADRVGALTRCPECRTVFRVKVC